MVFSKISNSLYILLDSYDILNLFFLLVKWHFYTAGDKRFISSIILYEIYTIMNSLKRYRLTFCIFLWIPEGHLLYNNVIVLSPILSTSRKERREREKWNVHKVWFTFFWFIRKYEKLFFDKFCDFFLLRPP